MTTITQSLTANGTADFNITKCGLYTIGGYGTWGSGTAAFSLSIDGGSTFITMTDAVMNGTNISYTANFVFNMFLNGDTISPPIMRITLSGATSPSLTFRIIREGNV